jgi:hypothetical protein
MAKTTPAAALAAETVRARVLFASAWGPVDSVVDVAPEEAAAGVAAGELDPDPASVAYAESLAATA